VGITFCPSYTLDGFAKNKNTRFRQRNTLKSIRSKNREKKICEGITIDQKKQNKLKGSEQFEVDDTRGSISIIKLTMKSARESEHYI